MKGEAMGINPEKPSYPIGTLSEMARIPDEALPRFIAELPAILRAHREIMEALPIMAQRTHERLPRVLRWLMSVKFIEAGLRRQFDIGRGLTWVDDDKGLATVTVRMSEDSAPLWSQSERLDA